MPEMAYRSFFVFLPVPGEKGRAGGNRLTVEVLPVLGGLLMLLAFPLGLSAGSFPRPLTAKEERMYLERFAQGDLEARNVLIERNLRFNSQIPSSSVNVTDTSQGLPYCS